MLDAKKSAKIFKALCDEYRVTIVHMLQKGEQCACNMSDALEISQPRLSYHMKILCESGIVECRYDGKWTFYRINVEGSKNAIKLLQDITQVYSTTSAKCEDCEKTAI